MDEKPSYRISRLYLAVGVLAGLLVAAALVWGSLHRGPWYDEFYTQYVTRAGTGWLADLRDSWLHDNHPPFYYALMRATAWLGDIETHRLVNVGIGAAALLGGALVVKEQRTLARPALLLLLLLMANPWTVHAGTELRSYFLSLCAGAVLALCLAAIWTGPAQMARSTQVVYTIAVFAAFNTHIITTIVSGAVILPFVVAALATKDWPKVRALLPAPLAAGIVFITITAIQLPHWERNTQVFWIASGFDAARYAMEYAVQRTLEANPLILLGAAVGGIMMCREFLRTRSNSGLILVAFLTGAGIALGFAVLMAIHLIRPILVEKYLTGAIGVIALILALACSHALSAAGRRTETGLLFGALIVSGFSLHANVREAAGQNSWLGTGRLIARTVSQCPATAVHTDDFWNAGVMAMSPADNRHVAPWAYAQIAKRLDFAVQASASHAMSSTCPNLFWAEHDTTHQFAEKNILEHLQRRGFALRTITLYRVGDGWVASDRPLNTGP